MHNEWIENWGRYVRCRHRLCQFSLSPNKTESGVASQQRHSITSQTQRFTTSMQLLAPALRRSSRKLSKTALLVGTVLHTILQ
jgi:hypothetical protein